MEYVVKVSSIIKKLPFYRRYTTNQNSKYWAKRKGWKEYQDTADHPHRHFISHILKQLEWKSLFEVGCGSGPNILNIIKNIPDKQLGGADVNSEAIEMCNKTFKGGHFRVASGDNLIMSDKSTDALLTDMCLIYIGPFQIKKYLKEFGRVTRNSLVLVEFHNKSWWKRQYLRVFSGRHSYNYKKLLEKLGYYDIQIIKIPQFEEDNEQQFRYLIIAKPPKL